MQSHATHLQVLLLPTAFDKPFTNIGDGRLGDTSSLITEVNANPELNGGHTDWRLPSFEELHSLVGTKSAPKWGWYWTAQEFLPNKQFCHVLYFPDGTRSLEKRTSKDLVVLVREAQQ